MSTIVVLGSGPAAWMAAALFVHRVGAAGYRITLVEDGQDTMTALAGRPSFTDFNRRLGIDLTEAGATPYLGTLYAGWRRDGGSYFHPLGGYGEDMDGIGFHHYWRRLAAGDPGRFSLETQAAKAGRFGDGLHHGYHVDAARWIACVRRRFPEITVTDRRTEGDLIIDASNPAAATTWTGDPDSALHATVTAEPDGWSWRMPLGAYSLCGKTGYDLLAFQGSWQGHTVTLRTLEPFGDLGLHLLQTAVERLAEVMPGPIRPSIVDRYNADMADAWAAVRDFILLRQVLSGRAADMPDSLKARLDMYAAAGHIPVPHAEIFTEADWFAHLSGLGFSPRAWHPIAGIAPETDLRLRLARLRTRIDEQVAAL